VHISPDLEQEIAISPPASPHTSPRADKVDRVSPTASHGDLGPLAC